MSSTDVTLTYPTLATPWTFTNVLADPITGKIDAYHAAQYLAARTALYFDAALRSHAEQMEAETQKLQGMQSALADLAAGTWPTSGQGLLDRTAAMETWDLKGGVDALKDDTMVYWRVGSTDPFPTPAKFPSPREAKYSGLSSSEWFQLFEQGAFGGSIPTYDRDRVIETTDGKVFVVTGDAVQQHFDYVYNLKYVVDLAGTDTAALSKTIQDAAVKTTETSLSMAAYTNEMTVSKGIWESALSQLVQRESSNKDRVIDNMK